MRVNIIEYYYWILIDKKKIDLVIIYIYVFVFKSFIPWLINNINKYIKNMHWYNQYIYRLIDGILTKIIHLIINDKSIIMV